MIEVHVLARESAREKCRVVQVCQKKSSFKSDGCRIRGKSSTQLSSTLRSSYNSYVEFPGGTGNMDEAALIAEEIYLQGLLGALDYLETNLLTHTRPKKRKLLRHTPKWALETQMKSNSCANLDDTAESACAGVEPLRQQAQSPIPCRHSLPRLA